VSALRGSQEEGCSEAVDLEEKLFPISLLRYGYNALKSLFSDLPLQVILYETGKLRRGLRADVERRRIELIFAYLLRMAAFGRPIPNLVRILGTTGSVDLFFGKLDTLPNADTAVYFARGVFPRVRRSIPRAEAQGHRSAEEGGTRPHRIRLRVPRAADLEGE
jgi:hypothetical protein